MKKLRITEVEAGEVVARAVTTNSGVVLMQPGAVLTSDLISRLVNLGVDMIAVEGTGPDTKSVEVQLAELADRFTGHEQDPLMMELQAIIATRIRQGATDGCDAG
ncbi:MAG TPA: hypothetical protein VGK32_00620 [Vicinamibacterales bacterium]|jgi:collagenase-like PrtC family protease